MSLIEAVLCDSPMCNCASVDHAPSENDLALRKRALIKAALRQFIIRKVEICSS